MPYFWAWIQLTRYASTMLFCRRVGIFLSFVFLAVTTSGVVYAATPPAGQPASHRLVIDELGKGVASLDGSWQFHLVDNPAWANPAWDDHSWEQLSADRPWSLQGHSGEASSARFTTPVFESAG